MTVNHKKVYRIYQELQIKIRLRTARKKALGIRQNSLTISKPNECWSLDFVHDSLQCERKIRILAVIDVYTREWLDIVVDSSLVGNKVKRSLKELLLLEENLSQFEVIMGVNLHPI